MKRYFFAISLFMFVFFAATLLTLYIQRNSRPALFCTSLDDSIRPRNYCLMNPFRDKQPEILAERIFQELKNGDINILLPYLNGLSDERNVTEDEIKRFLENEKRYKVKEWRIGNREDSETAIYITYRVSRENYYRDHNGNDILENVIFDFDPKSKQLRHISLFY